VTKKCSVADPRCLSRIPNTTIAPIEGGGIFSPTIFIATITYHKTVRNFIFEQVKNLFVSKTLRIVVLFTQKFVIKLKKNVMDLGSEIRGPDPKHCKKDV
jgi:hypothetical protein